MNWQRDPNARAGWQVCLVRPLKRNGRWEALAGIRGMPLRVTRGQDGPLALVACQHLHCQPLPYIDGELLQLVHSPKIGIDSIPVCVKVLAR